MTRRRILPALVLAGAITITAPQIADAHHPIVACASPGVWSIGNSERDRPMTFTTNRGHSGTVPKGGTVTVDFSGTSLTVHGRWSNGVKETRTGTGACTVPTTSPQSSSTTSTSSPTTSTMVQVTSTTAAPTTTAAPATTTTEATPWPSTSTSTTTTKTPPAASTSTTTTTTPPAAVPSSSVPVPPSTPNSETPPTTSASPPSTSGPRSPRSPGSPTATPAAATPTSSNTLPATGADQPTVLAAVAGLLTLTGVALYARSRRGAR